MPVVASYRDVFRSSKQLAGYLCLVPVPVSSPQPSCALLRVVGCEVELARWLAVVACLKNRTYCPMMDTQINPQDDGFLA
jgi:hypothetical protein